MSKKTDHPPLPTTFSGPRDSPGYLLWRLSNAWQRRQRAALQPLGLTHSQFVVLATTSWFGNSEELSQARIAQLSGMDTMTTSQVVRALESAGLLERRSHPSDPRAKAIAVTPAGLQTARKALLVVEQTDAAFFAPVSASQARLVKIFQTLLRQEEEDRAET